MNVTKIELTRGRSAYIMRSGTDYLVEIYPGDNCLPYVRRRFPTLAGAVGFVKSA
jgi:hypothetical protein